MRSSSLNVLLGVVVGADLIAMEPEGYIPEGWSCTGESSKDQFIELTFAVKQRNIEKLHDELMRVSSPASPDYGMHRSNDEVQAMTAPDPKHIDIVFDFARSFDAVAMKDTPNGDLVSVLVRVETAEKMLSTKYTQLRHEETGLLIHRALSGYSLPAAVATAVDFVSPTTHVPGVSRPIASTFKGGSSMPLNSPQNLHTLYNIKNVEGKVASNKQAVTAFLGEYYSEDGLQTFYKKWCDPANVSFACGKGVPKTVGDGTTGSMPGLESMLDIEYITAMGGNIASEFWGFKGQSLDNPANEPFMKWLSQVSKTSDDDVPKLFSTSYGEDENSWSVTAAKRLNTEFMKAGARGISLLFASGDSGANCKNRRFTPNMPASSPYVTAVGGTAPGPTHPEPGGERAVGLSSGGFSNYWAMPDYQKSAVDQYINQASFPSASTHGINISGRAFPDIAAQALHFPVAITGEISQIAGGTSCASPTVAGIFGLLNDLRLQNGKSQLGFLNPLIYSMPSSFNDITTGSGYGCGIDSEGYLATKGWDAVTGLGTPDFDKLAKAVLDLPAGRVAGAYQIIV